MSGSMVVRVLLAGLLLAAGPAGAQSAEPPPVGPAPNLTRCPPDTAKDAAGRCVALAAKPVAMPPAPVAKPAAVTIPAAKPPPVKPIAVAPMAAAAPPAVAAAELKGDCTRRAPNLIHDSRSPGGCAPCPRGRIPNGARQACVIPIPSPYRRPSGG